MASMKTFHDALTYEMALLLNAERQISRAVPKIVKQVSNAQLKSALQSHRKQTDEHVHRLEQAFEALGRKARATKSTAIEGLIDECEAAMEHSAEPHVRDAVILAAVQKIEHYEIACYGAACTWASELGESQVCQPLKQTIAEEKDANEQLKQIAKEMVNREAREAAA